MEMLGQQFIAGTLFVALVGICVTGVTWISSTLIDVDKNIAVMSVQTDQNSKKIDELHVMLKPMWEEFTGRSFENNAVYKR
jgi:hypothetical protein